MAYEADTRKFRAPWRALSADDKATFAAVERAVIASRAPAVAVPEDLRKLSEAIPGPLYFGIGERAEFAVGCVNFVRSLLTPPPRALWEAVSRSGPHLPGSCSGAPEGRAPPQEPPMTTPDAPAEIADRIRAFIQDCLDAGFVNAAVRGNLMAARDDVDKLRAALSSAPALPVEPAREAWRGLVTKKMVEKGAEGIARAHENHPLASYAPSVQAAFRRASRSALTAALAVAPPAAEWRVPEGYALVPVEPNEKMLVAAGATPDGVMPRGGVDRLRKLLPKYWRAMIKNAPPAPEPLR